MILSLSAYHLLLIGMSVVAVIVFIALYYVQAGYGMFRTGQWGISINNRLGWLLMEAPSFLIMLAFWYGSARRCELAPLVIFLLFELHYFQRAFVFPLLIRGKSKMPVAIMAMAMIFNLFNAYIQGAWLFYLAPASMYTPDWLYSPQFMIGTLLFFTGMIINIQSDSVIRGLRKPGDTKHYLPEKGLYRYVTSANYFGEIVEWAGFAILTWSWPGAVFLLWTMANLVPRADAIHKQYRAEFGEQVGNRKRVFPFIY